MRVLDRYVLRFFLLAYFVCFASLLSLYMVIDLFSRVDEFTQHSHGVRDMFANIGAYYFYRVPWFFQRLSGVICLMAAMFALAWLERNNEILPWLAAGVPARRLVYPILAACVVVIGLTIANREYVIPQCSPYLQRTAEDARGVSAQMVQPVYDASGIHIDGRYAFPEQKKILYANVLMPSELAGQMTELRCEEMWFRPRSATEDGGWVLNAATPSRLDAALPCVSWLSEGRYFFYTDATYERLTRKPDWFYYEPTTTLLHMAKHEPTCQRRAEAMALLHRRLTGPLLEFILILLGIPFMIGRFDRNMYLKVGVCMIVYAVFQTVQLLCTGLAQQELMDPALAAWLPVLIFGPAAMVMLDGIKT